MLERMDHRGACGCEDNTGDGAGILTGLPHEFLKTVAERDAGIALPPAGQYGVGIVFLPSDNEQRAFAEKVVERIIGEQGQKLLGWRDVPKDNSMIGHAAHASSRACGCCLWARRGRGGSEAKDAEALERQLYIIRKRAFREVRAMDMIESIYFYVCSLSTKVMIYKGQLTSLQVREYFLDLADPTYVSHLALVHSRLQHEYISQLGPRLPADALYGAQWRDQHAPRQFQLDDGARRDVQEQSLRQGD